MIALRGLLAANNRAASPQACLLALAQQTLKAAETLVEGTDSLARFVLALLIGDQRLPPRRRLDSRPALAAPQLDHGVCQ
jgi:hypothetical protein